MSRRLTLSEELTDRLSAQADICGHATVESLLVGILDEIEPADAAEARRLRRERTEERDRVLAEAEAAGWEEHPEIEEPDPSRTGRAGIPVAEVFERLQRKYGPAPEAPPADIDPAGSKVSGEPADALAAA